MDSSKLFAKDQNTVGIINQTQKKTFKKNSKLERIKSTLLGLILSSTSHGLPSVFRAERLFFKIMWFIFFVISTSLGIYMLFVSVLDYLSYNVVVKIDVINELPTQFVTVSFDSFRSDAPLEDNLLACYFNDDDSQLSDFEDLRYPRRDYRYFKFNSGKNSSGYSVDIKKVKKSGKSNGFTAEFFIGSPESFPYKDRYTKNYDHSFYIHNSSIDPIASDLDSIRISSGKSTNLLVKRVVSIKLGYPFNDCLPDVSRADAFDSVFFRHILTQTNSSYRQKDCFDLCQASYLINKCNNSIPLDTVKTLYSIYTSNLTDCFDYYWADFFKQDINEFCLPFCPLECQTISYDISMTFSEFPNPEYAKVLMQNPKIISKYPPNHNITYEELKQSVLSVTIYYEDNTYTEITQVAKTGITDLISSMGGLLGLFIGISFLSFGEIIEIIFEVIFILIEKDV